jgi:prevent-host-death family protein
MHEAKTNLSKLVARALAGEEVILINGKTRTPLARIVPVGPVDSSGSAESAAKIKRPIGLFASEMGPDSDYDWSEPMSEEELALWEAPIVSTWADNNGTPLVKEPATDEAIKEEPVTNK